MFDNINETNQCDLSRFVRAQSCSYESAKEELLNGRKESHWMWYIFPQLRGLGHSSISYEYGIENIEEARLYFNDKILGPRLVELCNILLKLECNDASRIFGYPDDMKLKSSMTLFYLATKEKVFKDVLDKFFNGELDNKTIELLGREQITL